MFYHTWNWSKSWWWGWSGRWGRLGGCCECSGCVSQFQCSAQLKLNNIQKYNFSQKGYCAITIATTLAGNYRIFKNHNIYHRNDEYGLCANTLEQGACFKYILPFQMRPARQTRPGPHQASSCLDTGLVVVVCITVSMIAIAIYCLVFVKYEWCHVLFKNNTVRQCSAIYCMVLV